MSDRTIRMTAFMNHTPLNSQAAGMWRHPRDTTLDHTRAAFWVELAQTLEAGLFDAIFLADTIGGSDVYGGNANAALRAGINIPRHDPLMVLAIMAASTEHVGLAVTANVLNTPPYLLARTLSTLDHLSDGRIGWNVVTGYLQSGARAVGGTLPPHDLRYEIAEEYMQVVYRLWEQSWEDGAYLADRSSGDIADPRKIHSVDHRGTHLTMSGIHMTEPSPQRTPVIFQAGASSKGKEFAGGNAECIFLIDAEKDGIKKSVDAIRAAAVEQGRAAHDIQLSMLVCVIVAPTREEAEAKLEDYRDYVDDEASLTLLSTFTGIDLSAYAMDDPFPTEKKDSALHSAVEQFISEDPDRVWTVGEVAKLAAIGGRGPVIVGSPHDVADELESWFIETGVDGFTLMGAVYPEGFSDFIELVVPILQERSLYKTEYAPGTLREKLFGRGALTMRSHPSASYRAD